MQNYSPHTLYKRNILLLLFSTLHAVNVSQIIIVNLFYVGQTTVSLKVTDRNNETVTENLLDVTVIREVRVIDTVFTSSVATLVSIIYINFGCALDWGGLKQNLKKPIGPILGLVTQFGLMPTVGRVL